MIQVTVHEAKERLSHLIQLALEGEDVVITCDARPLVKLTVLLEAQQSRRIGGASGVVVAMADDFDAPLNKTQPYMKT